jgi:hypothetical protein
MKKIIYIAFLGLILGATSSTASAQALHQGNFVADLYYGGPNWGKLLMERGAATNVSFSNVTGIGPAGIRLEYMVGDRIGVGADIIYNTFNSTVEYDSTDSQGLPKTYLGEAKMQRLRVHARFNYHFKVTNPNLDAYFGVGAGTNMRMWEISSDDPSFNQNQITRNGALLPVSARICTGIRYYFTPNIGLSGEIGLGGPLLSGGLTVKF